MFILDEGNKSLLFVPYSLLKIMYIRLIRNKPQGNAIIGRLVINGRWFCNTMERVGFQIPAICYPIRVTYSPKFKRLLPIVQNVPRSVPLSTEDSATSVRRSGGNVLRSTENECNEPYEINKISAPKGQGALRTGIRFHRGTRPEHSTGCILVVSDNNPMPLHPTPYTLHPPQGRTAADVEKQLTDLILKAQNEHEEIILEVTDFTPGTQYGYNTPCVRELQQHEIDARRAEQRYYELHPEECKG